MSLNGGYKIINFNGVPLDNNGTVTVAGIYNQITNNKSKSFLISGFRVDSAVYDDTFATITKNATNCVFEIYGYNVTVSNTDAVTVAEKIPDYVIVTNENTFAEVKAFANAGRAVFLKYEYETDNFVTFPLVNITNNAAVFTGCFKASAQSFVQFRSITCTASGWTKNASIKLTIES